MTGRQAERGGDRQIPERETVREPKRRENWRGITREREGEGRKAEI